MANFSTEADVRLKLQLNDTALVPTDLVNTSIDDAHELILRRLDASVDTQNPEPGLVAGETMVAGAQLLLSLAVKSAFAQKDVSIGGQRIDDDRFSSLMTASTSLELFAWQLLEPYMTPLASRTLADATETVAVLGET